MSALAHADEKATLCYRQAASLASQAARRVAASVKPGARLADLSLRGDWLIIKASHGQVNQGICHPTTVQRNNVIANYAAHKCDEVVEEGDLVKIQVGAHVNGYGAVVGINVSARGTDDFGEQAELVKEAKNVARLATDLVRPGQKCAEISKGVDSYLRGKPYKGVIGMPGHNHTRYNIQGPKLMNPFPGLGSETSDDAFEEGEVYTVEIWLTDAEDPVPVVAMNMETTLYMYLSSDETGCHSSAGVSEQAESLAEDIFISFKNLPFHSRHLPDLANPDDVENLVNAGVLAAYAPMIIPQKSAKVAQCVTTFIVTQCGVEVLSPQVLQ